MPRQERWERDKEIRSQSLGSYQHRRERGAGRHPPQSASRREERNRSQSLDRSDTYQRERSQTRSSSSSDSSDRKRSRSRSLDDVLRNSKRDVFSDETCSQSTGYAYTRSDEDQKAYLRSLWLMEQQAVAEAAAKGVHLLPNNNNNNTDEAAALRLSGNIQEHGEESTRDGEFSEEETGMTSIDLEAANGTTTDPEQAREETSLLDSNKTEEPVKENDEHLYALAICACCLLVVVIIGVIALIVVATQQEAAAAQKPETSAPTTSPISILDPTFAPLTSNTTTPTLSPTSAPTQVYYVEIPEWVDYYLPKETSTAIFQQPSSPQAQAFQFIQNDPYFNLNASSSSSNSSNITVTDILDLSPRELNEKRKNRFGLATLYHAAGGPYWSTSSPGDINDTTTSTTTTANWLFSADECEWSFYSCGQPQPQELQLQRQLQTTGATLQLIGANVSGYLPPEIFLLTRLQLLTILPVETIDNSTTIDMTTTAGGLVGTIPTQIGLLTDLRSLQLHGNMLSSEIPSEIGLLTNIQVLTLHNNAFAPNGTVPEQVCDLKRRHALTELSVDCQSVYCTCGCSCPTGGTSSDTENAQVDSDGNIFDHSKNASSLPNNTSISMTTATSAPVPSMTPLANSTLPFFNVSTDGLLCNGLPNTCDLRLNQVLFPMLHNAMADPQNGFLARNHNQPLEVAMDNGFRGINLDVCNCGGTLVFCHGVCGFGSRDPQQVFTNLLAFLQANPNEVFILTFQIASEVDQPVDLLEFYNIMQGIDGFTDFIYTHEVEDAPWPTLRELIGRDQRLVLFHFNGPTCDGGDPQICPPGMHYYFDYAAETAFEFSTQADLLDTSVSCQITRGGNAPHLAFFGINNFLKLPNSADASKLNAASFLEDRVTECSSANAGLNVSFLYIDFWSVGDTREFADNYNRNLGQGGGSR